MKSTSGIALGAVLVCLAFSGTSMGQNASDISGNYGGVWTNGMNAGTGFGAWAITSTNGTNFFSGNFIGSPTDAGITTFGTNAFGLYANPAGSPAFVQADRALLSPLTNGRTFSLRWAINYDSGSGNKGFNLYTGGTGGTQILNINNRDSAAITLNGADVGFGYGTTPMTWTFSQISSNTIRVAANDRDGTGNFATNVTVNGPADSFRIYAFAMQPGPEAQPYFNNFAISNTPAGLDTNPPTISLASGVNKITWVSNNGTVNLSTNDVIATDAEGGVSVTFSPTNVATTNNNFTTVVYTVTDAVGYRASVSRVIAVGNDGAQWFYSIYPRTQTVSTVTSATVGGELWVDGATIKGQGQATGVQAWVGVNATNNNPATWPESAWTLASYAGKAGDNNDKYEAPISGSNRAVGTHYYATRFRLGTNGGNTNFFYGGIDSTGQGGRWGTTRTATNNVVFTNGNGILTVEQGRRVSFAVDMDAQIKLGRFGHGSNKVFLMGEVTDWDNGVEMTRDGTTSIYRVTVPVVGPVNAAKLYKFRSDHPQGGYEGDVNPDANETARVLTMGATDTNLSTAFFNDEEFRNVTFSVDMNVAIFKKILNRTNQTVEIRGSLNGFNGGSALADPDMDGIYTGTFGVVGKRGDLHQHKFVIMGNSTETWENDFTTSSKNRETPLSANAVDMPLAKVFFNDISESRKLSFSVDMSEQVTKGNFIPGTHTAAVKTSRDNFAGSLLMNRVGTTFAYSLDYYLDGLFSDIPSSLEYKFFNSASTAPNSGFEGDQAGGANRILSKADIDPLNLSTNTIALATFVDVPRTTTTFDGWRGTNLATPELLTQYAFGALTPTNPASRANLPSGGVSSNQLVLTYYVRGDAQNSNLVVPQTHTNLADANGWTISGITVSSPLETNNVDGVNVVKRTASVPIDSTNRKFLRLKISE